MDTYDIQPYIGVGLLKFGMKKDAVEKIIGPPEKSRKSPMSNETVEFRQKSSLQLVYSADNGELAEISLYALGIPNVTFKDKAVFKMDGEKALKYLTEEDGNPLEDVGIILLPKLGITIGGFMRDSEASEKNIVAFIKGRWDDDMEEFKPYKHKPKLPVL